MAFSLLSSSSHIVLPWSPALVYKSLIDYDSWFEWLPSITSSRLLTKEDTLAIVQLGFSMREEDNLILECIQTTNDTVLTRVIVLQSSVKRADSVGDPTRGERRFQSNSVGRKADTPPSFESGVLASPESVRVPPGVAILDGGGVPGSPDFAERRKPLRTVGNRYASCAGYAEKYLLTPTDDKPVVETELPGPHKSRV